MNCHENSGLDGWPEHRFFPAIAAAAPEWEGWCLWQELGDSNDFYGCMGGTSSTKSWSIHYQWWSSAIGYLLRKRSKKQILWFWGLLDTTLLQSHLLFLWYVVLTKSFASAFISFPYLSMHAHTFGTRWININQHIVLFLYEWLRISCVFAITSSLTKSHKSHKSSCPPQTAQKAQGSLGSAQCLFDRINTIVNQHHRYVYARPFNNALFPHSQWH